MSVREFATFTPDLHQLADWLEQCGVDTVVMESTGVFWIPVFELLEQRGFTQRVPGAARRRPQSQECQRPQVRCA